MSDPKQPTITTLLNKLASDICDNYCKHQERYMEDDEAELLKHCEECPLNILGI